MKKLILILIALVVGGMLILNVGVNVKALAVTCYEQCEIDEKDCEAGCGGNPICDTECFFDESDCECICDGYTGYDSETGECFY